MPLIVFTLMAAEYPKVSNYKPFYIQIDGEFTAINIADEWGFVVRTSPLTDLPDMKEPASNNWHDEDGLEEYIKDPHFQAVSYTIDFYIKTQSTSAASAADILVARKRDFFDRVCRHTFSFYDCFWKFGRKEVRYSSYSEGEKKQGPGWARQIFSVTFQINEPMVEMTYADGKITER